MVHLGIEALTVFSLQPVQFINLAGDLGCRHISTGLNSMPFGPRTCAPWSLRDDASLRRETRAAIADRGVSISLGEGLIIRPGVEVADYQADMELFRELGTTRINTVVMDPDLQRGMEQIGRLADMAQALDMETTLELPPTSVIGGLAAGVAALGELRRPNLRLLIDTMHFFRSGSRMEDLAALDPDLIGYVQLSDVPLVASNPDYMDEAMFGRLPPGEGELPLLEMLKVLPRDRVTSLEVPSRAWVESGRDIAAWAGHCVSAARRLLQQLSE